MTLAALALTLVLVLGFTWVCAPLFSIPSRAEDRPRFGRAAYDARRAVEAQEAAAIAALTPEDVASLEALGWKPPRPTPKSYALDGVVWMERMASLGSTMHAGGLVISSEGVHRAPALRVGDRVVINCAYFHTDRHHNGKTGVVTAVWSNPRAYNVAVDGGHVVRTMNVSPAPEHAPGTEVMTRLGPVTLGVRAATPEELRFDPYADGTLKRPMSLVSRDGFV